LTVREAFVRSRRFCPRFRDVENLRESVYRLRKGQFLNERHATQHVGLASSVAQYSQHPVIIEGVHPRLAAVP
jgi:hypothetical protein